MPTGDSGSWAQAGHEVTAGAPTTPSGHLAGGGLAIATLVNARDHGLPLPAAAFVMSGQDAALGLISPVFAELSGLPPLIIQAGTYEVLLDDAIRLARQAATADVAVTLDITPGVPHVFQAYYPILDEAAAALDRAGQLLSEHLASAERVTS